MENFDPKGLKDHSVEEQDDFVLVGRTGEPIPAGAEGSVLMALQLQQKVANGTLHLETTTSTEPPVATAQTPTSISSGTNGAALAPGQDDVVADSPITAVGSENHDDEPDFSREYSDQPAGEEEWILEEILRHRDRKLKKLELGEPAHTVSSKKASLWETATIPQKSVPVTPSVVAGVTEYLCKWKWYREPTWETEERLRSEGYETDLVAYIREQETGTQQQPTPPAAATVAKPAQIPQQQQSKAPLRSEAFASVTTLNDLLSVAAPYFLEETQRLLQKEGRRVTEIIPIASEKRIREHVEYFRTTIKYNPIPVFHGTRPENLASISRLGLVTPGTHDVIEEHGNLWSMAVDGPGIYAATDFLSAYEFASNDQDYVMVCLAVEQHCVRCHSMLAFQEEACVVPVWIIRAPKITTPSKTPPKERTLADLLKQLLGERKAMKCMPELRKAHWEYVDPSQTADGESPNDNDGEQGTTAAAGETETDSIAQPTTSTTNGVIPPMEPPEAVVVHKPVAAKAGRLKSSGAGGHRKMMKRQQAKSASEGMLPQKGPTAKPSKSME